MAMDKCPITAAGYEKMIQEVKHLKTVLRPEITNEIARARELGDLSENAEYHAAREKQSFVEGRIIEIEDKIARAEVIDVSKLSGTTIMFGATVTLIDEDSEEEKTYQIVGEYEADLNQGLISNTSPLSRALIGKKKGDNIEVITPKGVKYYEVTDVQYS